ncbi:carboxypeptidase-like regulatory domain-containing protein [Pyrinomonas sp.]|uniref:TonB-dependent receptor n=1 Tax=Pyrinomonas sp. TaxID=2080306 RepID=UPI00331F4EB1
MKMKKARLPFGAAVVGALLLCIALPAAEVLGSSRPFGTITGSVRDEQGRPLAGALIILVREGAEKIVRQTRSSTDGSFSLRALPGRYILRAIADGFNATSFASVVVTPSSELVYRFNLEPVGLGRTLPERRTDRGDPKWRLRLANNRRSVFNLEEEEPRAPFEEPPTRREAHGVVETYFAASDGVLRRTVPGVNFAVATPVNADLDLVFVGQVSAGAGSRFEATARRRINDRHRASVTIGSAQAKLLVAQQSHPLLNEDLQQLSVRAVDEWVVRDGVVVLLGLDYARLVGAGDAGSLVPRLGMQFDLNARTRVRAAYAAAPKERTHRETVVEGSEATFERVGTQPVALVDGRAVVERSRRLEIGLERVLDERSRVEATAFFDTVDGRGVGLMALPPTATKGEGGAELLRIANQQGAARGLRVIYTRRISRALSASAGYSFGHGQELSAEGLRDPARLFRDGLFQTVAAQMDADLGSGTRVQTVFRFSPRATIFAIDPFAGRLAVYDPSLSILVTQELPTFGLPVRAEAVLDARNVLNLQPNADDGEKVVFVSSLPRSVRGGILIRF